MKIKLTSKSKELIDGIWVKFNDEVKLHIRMPDRYKISTIDSDLSMIGKMVILSVDEWEGFIDDDDKPLPCTQDNIEAVIKLNPDLFDFLVEEVSDIFDRLNRQSKN